MRMLITNQTKLCKFYPSVNPALYLEGYPRTPISEFITVATAASVVPGSVGRARKGALRNFIAPGYVALSVRYNT